MKWHPAILLTAVAFLWLGGASAAQDVGGEAQLGERVKQFNSALELRQFDSIWSGFLGPILQRETPREKYVGQLRQTFGDAQIRVLGPERVTVNPVTKEEQLTGRAVSHIEIMTKEGDRFRLEHTTVWAWLPRADRRGLNWFLVRDSIKEPEVAASAWPPSSYGFLVAPEAKVPSSTITPAAGRP